jgi:hypothetical protein
VTAYDEVDAYMSKKTTIVWEDRFKVLDSPTQAQQVLVNKNIHQIGGTDVGVYVCGYVHGGYGVFVRKYAVDGTLLWSLPPEGITEPEIPVAVNCTGLGFIQPSVGDARLFAGGFAPNEAMSAIVAIDSMSGTVDWAVQWPDAYVVSMATDPSQSVYVAAVQNSPWLSVVRKYDFDGNFQWERSWSRGDEVENLLYAWGSVFASGTAGGHLGLFVRRYSATGDLQWGPKTYAGFTDVRDMSYVVMGGTDPPEIALGGGNVAPFVMNLTLDGDVSWTYDFWDQLDVDHVSGLTRVTAGIGVGSQGYHCWTGYRTEIDSWSDGYVGIIAK